MRTAHEADFDAKLSHWQDVFIGMVDYMLCELRRSPGDPDVEYVRRKAVRFTELANNYRLGFFNAQRDVGHMEEILLDLRLRYGPLERYAAYRHPLEGKPLHEKPSSPPMLGS